MKNISTKTLLIIIAPVIIGLFVFLFSEELGFEKEKKQEKKKDAIVIPENENDEYTDSKREAYEYRDEKQNEKRRLTKKMGDDNFYQMENNREEKKEEEEKEEVKKEKKENPYIAKDKRLQKKTMKSKESNLETRRRQYEKEEEEEKEEKVEKEEKKEKIVYSSFGQPTQTDDGLKNTIGFIEASLEKGDKVKDGSEVVFILHDDCVIDGVFIEKLSLMYGKVEFGDQRIYVNINMIRDSEGNKYNVDLSGYNENYQQGIYYDGKLDEARDKGQNEIMKDGASSLTKTGQISNLLNGAVRTTSRAFKKDAEISISKGYKMYFKNEKIN